MKRAKIFLSDDLIIEILIRSPARSIGRFRCVCKRWRSLSSDPKFALAHASRAQISALLGPNCNHVFLDSRRRQPSYYIPSLPGLPSIESSCNGLILIRFRQNNAPYCILFNPVTMTSWPAISLPEYENILKVTLAFDPSRSLHFKIVALCWEAAPYVKIYSSCTRKWRPIASAGWNISFDSAVYFKAHILWWDRSNDCLVCFDVESERFQTRVQLPPDNKTLHHLGASGGELHFIGRRKASKKLPTVFEVWQLLPDFSGWSPLYIVDRLDILKTLYPADPVPSYRRKEGHAVYFHRENGGGDQLLMNSKDKLFSYHLQTNTCTILSHKLKPTYSWWWAFPYAETILSPDGQADLTEEPEEITAKVR